MLVNRLDPYDSPFHREMNIADHDWISIMNQLLLQALEEVSVVFKIKSSQQYFAVVYDYKHRISCVGFDTEIHLVQNFWTSPTDFLYARMHEFQNFWNLHKIAVQ
jgi:hypothetical protein